MTEKRIKYYILVLTLMHYSWRITSVVLFVIHTLYLILFVLMNIDMGMVYRIPFILLYAVPVYVFLRIMFNKIDLKRQYKALKHKTFTYAEYEINEKNDEKKTLKTKEQGILGCLLQDDFDTLQVQGTVGYLELFDIKTKKLIGRFYVKPE